MTVKVAGRAAALFIFFLILSSCGDMTTLFPAAGDSYLVRASVNGMSLEGGSSILRSGDKVFPYFAISVRGDPDVTGLLVYMRNSYGEIIGDVTKFVIGIPSSETPETETETGANVDDEADDDDDEWGIGAISRSVLSNSATEVAIRSFEQDLPPFVLPENMEIGPHTIIFEVLGGRTVLRRTEIPIFYLGDADFSLRGISMSLPGLFGSRLVPPGTKVLMEARLVFDRRLDPYLIWHSGRNIIHEGRMSEGAGSILWEAPGQTAFHPLRLEILPFPPVGIRRNLVGISREILLPVSATAEGAGFFFGTGQNHPARNRLAEGIFHLDHIHIHTHAEPPDGEDEYEYDEACTEEILEKPTLYRWYQFKGRLHDTMSAQDEDRFLVSAGEILPHWVSIGHSYGLSTGDNNAFQLSPINFFREEQDHGGGIFLFHVRPVAEGTILSAFFPSDSPGRGAWLDMSRKGDTLVLRLGTAEATVEMPMFLSHSDLQNLVPAAVKFYIHPDYIEANLSIGENAFLQSTVQSVRLSGALTGEGILRLGGEPLDSWAQAPARVVTRLATINRAPREMPASVTTPRDTGDDEEDTDLPDDFATDYTEQDEAEFFPPPSFMEAELIDPSVTTVWNEFAVMLSSIPFPRLELPEPDLMAYDVPPDEEYPEEEAIADAEDDDPATELVAINPESIEHPAYTQMENGSMAPDFTEAEARETGPGTTLYETTETYAEETEMPT